MIEMGKEKGTLLRITSGYTMHPGWIGRIVTLIEDNRDYGYVWANVEDFGPAVFRTHEIEEVKENG